jgi:hypothetical protein
LHEIRTLLHGISSCFGSVCRPFHFNKFCTKTVHFFFNGRSCIEHFHYRSQSACSSDCLKSCHPGTEYQYFCRGNAAGSSHEHGEIPAVIICGVDHCFISRDVSLGTEYIHALGTGGTGKHVETKGNDVTACPFRHLPAIE